MGKKIRWYHCSTLIVFVILAALCLPQPAFSAKVRWYTYEEGLTLGKQDNKKVFLYFWADWCKFCEKMEKETLSKPEVSTYLNKNFISVKVNSDKEQGIFSKYFSRGVPNSWFIDERGGKISNLPGYVPSIMFLPILKYIQTDSYKKMSFKDFSNNK